MSINVVNSVVQRLIPEMFNHSSGRKEFIGEQPWPAISEVISGISLSGETFKAQLLIGFPRELLLSFLRNLLQKVDSMPNLDLLIHSTAAEFANLLASYLAVDPQFISRLGIPQMSCPRIWSSLEDDKMYMPLERGERGVVFVEDYAIDTFVSYSVQSAETRVCYATGATSTLEGYTSRRRPLSDSLSSLKLMKKKLFK